MSDADKAAAEAADATAPQPQRSTPPTLFDRLRILFGVAPASVRDDIEDALDEAGPDADFTPQERAILKNVLGLNEVRVKDLMIPRPDIIAVEIETPLSEVLNLFRTAGHSRLPVYGDNLDDPRGMVHIRDFVDYLAAEPQLGLAPDAGAGKPRDAAFAGMKTPLSAAKILRPVLFAPPSMPALDLLVKMQASHTHMALVIDEYGGTDGLVSIEDVVEAIVGDIEDEHDEEDDPEIAKAPDGGLIVEARASLESVSAALGIDLSKLEVAEDVDTIGGLIAAEAGRVPGRGEIVAGPGDLEFEVLDADPRRIKRVKIHTNAGGARAGAKRRPASDAKT
jgi:CBS domain containing-hemolysin-like protein